MVHVTVTAAPPDSSTYPPIHIDPLLKGYNGGVKRDPSIFQTFKFETQWSDWKDHIIVTIDSQNVEDVIDSLFIPIGTSAIDLFVAKQKYVFQSCITYLKTDKGK